MIPWEAIEAQARDTAFQAVVVSGVAVLVGSACVLSMWALKRALRMMGLYSDFIAFSRYRKQR
jgi:hypothetical protein